MSEFCHFTDIYSIGQMSEYVLFYGHLSYRLDVYRSDGVTPKILRTLTCAPFRYTNTIQSGVDGWQKLKLKTIPAPI